MRKKSFCVKSQDPKEEEWHITIDHTYIYLMPKGIDLWGTVYPGNRKAEYINWCYCGEAIVYSCTAAIPRFVIKGLHGIINKQIREME